MIRRLQSQLSLLISAGYSDTDLSNVGSTEEHMIPTELGINDIYLTNVLVNVLANVLVTFNFYPKNLFIRQTYGYIVVV